MGILVEVVVPVRLLGHEFAAPRLGSIRPVEGTRLNDVDPEAAEDGLALRTGVGGQAQCEGQAQRCAQRTIGDAGVATAGVEQLATCILSWAQS
mgnify:CR=1 FL=1